MEACIGGQRAPTTLAVVPVAESCDTPDDEDCDGTADEDCGPSLMCDCTTNDACLYKADGTLINGYTLHPAHTGQGTYIRINSLVESTAWRSAKGTSATSGGDSPVDKPEEVQPKFRL